MKRPYVLIVGAAAGALLVAAVGASAHTGFTLTKAFGIHSGVLGDEATGARTETPEPTEPPEASPTAEPTETPEPADTDTDVDNETETHEDTRDNEANTTTKATRGEHDRGAGAGRATQI